MSDVISRYIGQDINPIQISFIRFFISMVSVIPFMLPKGKFYFKLRMPKLHFWRAFWGALAIGLGTFSVLKFQIGYNTSIMFAEPLIFLPLAAIFLKEKVDAARWICTLAGAVGIATILYNDILNFNIWFFVPLLSAFLFAVICVIAKKMVYDEHILTLLFYFGLGTTLLFLVPALIVWKPMTLKQILLLTVLGINANLIQVCMFKAYAISDASPLMTIRYVELVFAFLAGFLFFDQIPTITTIIGGVIIILSSIAITAIEKRKERY